MTVEASGAVTASDLYRALVVNRAKLAYNGVARWLEGAAAAAPAQLAVDGLDRQLRIQDSVARRSSAYAKPTEHWIWTPSSPHRCSRASG